MLLLIAGCQKVGHLFILQPKVSVLRPRVTRCVHEEKEVVVVVVMVSEEVKNATIFAFT